jgi:multicomponent Na+:H+ antiporter subunit F
MIGPLDIALIGIVGTMFMALIRALRGPTLYDRILAVNLFGTKTVLIIAVLSYLDGRDWLDIALVYALINFLAVIAVLKLMQNRTLSQAEPRE